MLFKFSINSSFKLLLYFKNTLSGKNQILKGFNLRSIKYKKELEIKYDDLSIDSIISKMAFLSDGKNIRGEILKMSSYLLNSHFNNSIDLTDSQKAIISFAKLVHSASLIHDDIVDDCKLRRDKECLHILIGKHKAVLVGNKMIGDATKLISDIGDPVLIEILSKTLEELISGEFLQLEKSYDMDKYIEKCYLKTGSVYANTCKSIAHVTNNCTKEDINNLYNFGRNYGIAFQILDDIRDYFQEDDTGKPKLSDFKNKIITAPVIYSYNKHPNIIKWFDNPNNKQYDVNLSNIIISNGMKDSKELLEKYTCLAIDSMLKYKESKYSSELLIYVRNTLKPPHKSD